MAGKFQFTLQEYQEAAVKYRSDLLMLPIIGIGDTLQYMTGRPGIRYKERVGTLTGDAQFAPYNPQRAVDYNLGIAFRDLETHSGSVVANALHRNKTVVYYYDATALGSNYAVNEQDFHFVVCHEFELHGWRVESVYLGNPMRHDEFSCQREQSQARLNYAECSRECVCEKYLLINEGLLPEVAYFVVAGKQRLMPFFNRSNNEDLILAIQSAGGQSGSQRLSQRQVGREVSRV